VCTPAEHCPIDWLRPARCERACSLHSACRSRPPHVAQSELCAPSSAREMVSARREEISRLRALLKRATFVVAMQRSRVVLPPCLFSELGGAIDCGSCPSAPHSPFDDPLHAFPRQPDS